MPISDRDQRMLRIGGIVIGVLLVGFLLLKLLGGGGEEEAFPSSSPLRPASSSTQPTGTPSLAPSPILVLPVRDPFSIPPDSRPRPPPPAGRRPPPPAGPRRHPRAGPRRRPPPRRRRSRATAPARRWGGTRWSCWTPSRPTGSSRRRSRSMGRFMTRRSDRPSARTSSTDCSRSRGTVPRSSTATNRSRSACRRTSRGRRRRRRCAHGGSGRRSSGGGPVGPPPPPFPAAIGVRQPFPMMGRMLRLLTAGESHGPGLAVILEGLPAGVPVSTASFAGELARGGTATAAGDGSASRRTRSRSKRGSDTGKRSARRLRSRSRTSSTRRSTGS